MDLYILVSIQVYGLWRQLPGLPWRIVCLPRDPDQSPALTVVLTIGLALTLPLMQYNMAFGTNRTPV